MENFENENDLRRDATAKSLSFFCKHDFVKITKKTIDMLIIESGKNNKCNARICLHNSPENNFHEMIVLEYSDKYYRPHKHLYKGESCHILRGKMAILYFGEEGELLNNAILGGKKNIICRVGVNCYHAILPLTKHVIYCESKPGPYLGEKDSIYPKWAPDFSDKKAIEEYKKNILKIIGKETK